MVQANGVGGGGGGGFGGAAPMETAAPAFGGGGGGGFGGAAPAVPANAAAAKTTALQPAAEPAAPAATAAPGNDGSGDFIVVTATMQDAIVSVADVHVFHNYTALNHHLTANGMVCHTGRRSTWVPGQAVRTRNGKRLGIEKPFSLRTSGYKKAAIIELERNLQERQVAQTLVNNNGVLTFSVTLFWDSGGQAARDHPDVVVLHARAAAHAKVIYLRARNNGFVALKRGPKRNVDDQSVLALFKVENRQWLLVSKMKASLVTSETLTHWLASNDITIGAVDASRSSSSKHRRASVRYTDSNGTFQPYSLWCYQRC